MFVFCSLDMGSWLCFLTSLGSVPTHVNGRGREKGDLGLRREATDLASPSAVPLPATWPLFFLKAEPPSTYQRPALLETLPCVYLAACICSPVFALGFLHFGSFVFSFVSHLPDGSHLGAVFSCGKGLVCFN